MMRASSILFYTILFYTAFKDGKATELCTSQTTVGQDIESNFDLPAHCSSRLRYHSEDEGLRDVGNASSSKPDVYYNAISARSPARSAKNNPDIVLSGRKFGFIGHQGAHVLEGAGQRLVANQEEAQDRVDNAQARVDTSEGKIETKVWNLRSATNRKDQGVLFRGLNRAWNSRMQQLHELTDAQQDMRETGKTMEHAGMVNKNMRTRMLKNFPPMGNPNKGQERRAAQRRRERDLKRAASVAAKKQLREQKQAKVVRHKTGKGPYKAGVRRVRD